jgi:hypothetical protein
MADPLELHIVKLTEELLKVSGWRDTKEELFIYKDEISIHPKDYPVLQRPVKQLPFYDWYFLLRHLPHHVEISRNIYVFVLTNHTTDDTWIADYIMPAWQEPLSDRTKDVWLHHGDNAKLTEDEDSIAAILKLFIRLFRLNILKEKRPKVRRERI